MKIAVVGAGVFGCTIAWHLAKEGFDVDLFEKNSDIFMAASGINQFRLHRGYHYPRSKETILSCIEGELRFRKVYPECVIDDPHKHYYGIAKEKSFLNADQCFKIWEECGLEFEEVELDFVNKDAFQAIVKVREAVMDPEKLKSTCLERINKYGVNLILNKKVEYSELNNYDIIVNVTYADSNYLLKEFPESKKTYQFEIIEKMVLKLPSRFDNVSFVVQDGPFTCIDPFGRTGYTLMGNVEHAIHKREVGDFVDIPDEFKPLINKGIIKNPKITKINEFLEAAEFFFPGIKDSAEHVGSMFTVRTVLPFREHDDARPTIVERINNNLIRVFSGKIPTCCDAAQEVLNIVKNFHD